MAKKLLLLTLISVILGSVLWLGFEAPAIVSAATPAGAQLSCAQPSRDALPLCRAMEQRILAATVRIELVSWLVADNDAGYEIDSSIGHATVKDGRYLVTHNHFSIPLSIRPRAGEPEVYAVVKLSNSSGELLFEGPLSDFELVLEEPGTLVIAHKDEGLLMRLGFASAPFANGSSATLSAGMEVAQVDWDGATARVDWTTVKEVDLQAGVPMVVLADDVLKGASGGGIFWQGVHIANNWLQVQFYDAAGAPLDFVTKATLNSIQVAGEPSQALSSG